MQTQILIDSKGQKFTVVKGWWANIITIFTILNFIVLMLIVAVVIDNRRAVDDTTALNDKMKQRLQASEELSRNRAEIEAYVYDRACKDAQAHGDKCLDNPQFWADPFKYPALFNDPMGAGLFYRPEQH